MFVLVRNSRGAASRRPACVSHIAEGKSGPQSPAQARETRGAASHQSRNVQLCSDILLHVPTPRCIAGQGRAVGAAAAGQAMLSKYPAQTRNNQDLLICVVASRGGASAARVCQRGRPSFMMCRSPGRLFISGGRSAVIRKERRVTVVPDTLPPHSDRAT